MHVQTGCSGNDSDIVIPSLPCSDSQPEDSPCFLMDGLGTKHRVWFQRFGTRLFRSQDRNGNVTVNYRFCPAVSVPLSIALPIWVS